MILEPTLKVDLVEAYDPVQAAIIHRLNEAFTDDFYVLTAEDIRDGGWVTAVIDDRPVGFAGWVPFSPFKDVAYFKRVAVLPEARGKNLSTTMMALCVRDCVARGYRQMVSSCSVGNIHSANNFIRAGGWRMTLPHKPWEDDSLFWVLDL